MILVMAVVGIVRVVGEKGRGGRLRPHRPAEDVLV